MKAPAFTYHAPRSRAEVLGMLASLEGARLLAGGQSLMPLLNFRLAAPEHLIDLNRIPELSGIRVDGGTLHIGAMTRQREVQQSGLVHTHVPLLQAALAHVGHQQTRNRGTLGGSLCHLDPAAELVTAAATLDATLIAESARGTRRIPLAAWCDGYLTNALEPGELLAEVEFPVWPAGHGYAFSEYARRKGDFAIVGVAALVTLTKSGAVDRIALAAGGCAAAPQRLTAVEASLSGKAPDAESIREAARLASGIEAQSDPYVSADYRRHLARVMTERSLTDAVRRAKGRT
jgi:carbon-monoxide dehydrogenase medium subunit